MLRRYGHLTWDPIENTYTMNQRLHCLLIVFSDPKDDFYWRHTWYGEFFLSSKHMYFHKITCIIQWISIYLSIHLSIYPSIYHLPVKTIHKSKGLEIWISGEGIWFSHLVLTLVSAERTWVRDISFGVGYLFQAYVFLPNQSLLYLVLLPLKSSLIPCTYLYNIFCMFLLDWIISINLFYYLYHFSTISCSNCKHRGIDFYIHFPEVYALNSPLKTKLLYSLLQPNFICNVHLECCAFLCFSRS